MSNGLFPYPPPYYQQPQPTTTAPTPGAGGQVPQYHLPDDSAVAQAYQQHAQEAASWGQGSGPQYVKWVGPAGQTRWDASVPAGYEASVYVYILPPWAAGKGIFNATRSHFWKSMTSPSGTSIGCPGSDRCLICQAREVAMRHPDPQMVERAKQFGRVRSQFLYNVVLLDNPNGHFGQDGLMRPFILGAGSLLHKALGDIIEDKRGAINVVDPMRGRPIRLKRRKTGPQMMDVEYSAIAQDPMPLDPGFYPCLQNIWDLEKLDRQPDMEAMTKAVQDMGLPMPGMAPLAPPQMAPFANPYQPGQVGRPSSPVYMPSPADPYDFPGPQAQQPAWGPMVQPPAWQVPTPPPPPAMTPPPVQSAPMPQTTYWPQAGQVPAPMPPGPPVPAPQSWPAQGIPPAPPITAPYQAGAQPVRQPVAQAPMTRPPCFGRYNAQDRMCQGCPDQLKGECANQPGQQALGDLQNQLAGQ
ncbi:MAG: hypothetical protein A2Y61_00395 [Chloroflexi bacterium RBG_13_60_13]|nr:MAG: hypothetical protein A2Y61_00395 [Chloroflexi bacterium RBG_13_60_13]